MLYDHVIAAFPDAYLEDPHDLPEIAGRLGDHLERVSYDSPIRSAEDIGATPLAARVVNAQALAHWQPARALRGLPPLRAERRPMYGGGMGELVAAGRSSCSPRYSTPTRPTMLRRAPTTRTTSGRPADQPAGAAPRGGRFPLDGVDAHDRSAGAPHDVSIGNRTSRHCTDRCRTRSRN